MDTKQPLTPQQALTNLANVANLYLCNQDDRQALNESILVLDTLVKSQEIFEANPLTERLHPKKVVGASKESEPSEKEPEPTDEPEGESPTTAPELPNLQPDDDPVDPEVDPDRPF